MVLWTVITILIVLFVGATLLAGISRKNHRTLGGISGIIPIPYRPDEHG
jgi:hypothetical protein